MAWTDPKTWAIGDVLTASDMNTYVRDNTTDRPRARVSRSSTTQAIPNNTTTAVVWDTEELDTDGMVSLGTNAQRITVQHDGDYLVGAHVLFFGHADGGARTLYLEKNGTVFAEVQGQPDAASSPQAIGLSVTDLITAVAGDYFEAAMFQNSGVSLNIGAGEQYAAMFVAWQGA